jgi:hypothetical protein
MKCESCSNTVEYMQGSICSDCKKQLKKEKDEDKAFDIVMNTSHNFTQQNLDTYTENKLKLIAKHLRIRKYTKLCKPILISEINEMYSNILKNTKAEDYEFIMRKYLTEHKNVKLQFCEIGGKIVGIAI